jgi:hypothetical protein
MRLAVVRRRLPRRRAGALDDAVPPLPACLQLPRAILPPPLPPSPQDDWRRRTVIMTAMVLTAAVLTASETIVRALKPAPIDATWTDPRRTAADMRADREQFLPLMVDRERIAQLDRLQTEINRLMAEARRR